MTRILEVDRGLEEGEDAEEDEAVARSGLSIRLSNTWALELRLWWMSVLKPYFSDSRFESMNCDLTNTSPLLVECLLNNALMGEVAGWSEGVMVVEKEARCDALVLVIVVVVPATVIGVVVAAMTVEGREGDDWVEMGMGGLG